MGCFPVDLQDLVAQTLHHLCCATAVALHWCRIFCLMFSQCRTRIALHPLKCLKKGPVAPLGGGVCRSYSVASSRYTATLSFRKGGDPWRRIQEPIKVMVRVGDSVGCLIQRRSWRDAKRGGRELCGTLLELVVYQRIPCRWKLLREVFLGILHAKKLCITYSFIVENPNIFR